MLLSSSLLQKHCCKHFFLGLYRNYQILCKIHPLHNQQQLTHSLSLRAKTGPHFPRQRCSFLIDISLMLVYIIHLMSDPQGNSQFCFPRVPIFPSSRETSGLSGNKTNWFSEEPDIKCFVIFLDFHFNNDKKITRANQKSRLHSDKSTNLILRITE